MLDTVLDSKRIEQFQYISSDLVTNGDFDKYDSACFAVHSAVQPCPDPYNSGCINAWSASHGSPEFSIKENVVVLGSVKTNGYQWGEGIFHVLDHPVDSGETYVLLFDFISEAESCTDKSFLSVQFTNNEFHPGTCFEMLPIPGWEIPGSPFQVQQEQKKIMVIFKALDKFRKIWFYPINESDSVTWIKIRNIHLFNLDDISLRPQLFLSEGTYEGKLTPLFITNPDQAAVATKKAKKDAVIGPE